MNETMVYGARGFGKTYYLDHGKIDEATACFNCMTEVYAEMIEEHCSGHRSPPVPVDVEAEVAGLLELAHELKP